MNTSTPVSCPDCGEASWRVTYRSWVDSTVEYTMSTPGAVDQPRETKREADEAFAFACAACGRGADDDGDEILREQARRVSLAVDGVIDWQSEPGE